MTKKKYIYLMAMVGLVNFVSYFFIRDINIWAMVTCILLGILYIYIYIHRIFYYLKKAIIY